MSKPKPLHHSHAPLRATLLAGLLLACALLPAAAAPTAGELPRGVVERELWLPTPMGPLRALFTYPQGKTNLPAAVIVGGSGPLDADGTVGSLTPYRDIAWGLAQRGVAVLRTDKRTLALAASLHADTLTLEQEYLEDVAAAAALLREQAQVNPGRVFLVGHSLGALLCPLLAPTVDAAGMALLCAPAGEYHELVLRQAQYLHAHGELDAATLALVAQQALHLRQGTGRGLPARDLLGLPWAYWQRLFAYDAIQTIGSLEPLPVFILAGGRDYQVPPDQFEAYRAALEGQDNVAFYFDETLNHYLCSVPAPATSAQYLQPLCVDGAALDALAAFLLAH